MDIDYSLDLVTVVTVLSATATHVPPSGAASVQVVGAIQGGVIVPVLLGPLTVTGIHILDVVATYSNGEISEVRVHITVEY